MSSLDALNSNARAHPPQAFLSTYAPRVRTFGNALLTPIQPQNVLPTIRTKRGTTAVNYADDAFDDDDFTTEGDSRRPTGLRSRRDPNELAAEKAKESELGKEIFAPVELQGIWRDWMGKAKKILTEREKQIQCVLPTNLVPIRIDLDIQPFRPDAALPVPNSAAHRYGIDENLPAYRRPEITSPFRLKDFFLWNLHEALITPDMFAKILVEDLDLPTERKTEYIIRISSQIREQLEQYAGIALHPLFSPLSNSNLANRTSAAPPATVTNGHDNASVHVNGTSTPNAINLGTPQPSQSAAITPVASAATPLPVNGLSQTRPQTPIAEPLVTATASQPTDLSSSRDHHNPDDNYRCIISLSINLLNRLYTDRFEWSLLHPPGFAEDFARITCADLGLTPEWSAAIAHSIYEAVLRLKKEVCENGGLLPGIDVDNDCVYGAEAGWRYDVDGTGSAGDRWEPKVEVLSKEEIEKREGDRERQLRRMRRETARFSSAANMTPIQDLTATPGEDAMGRGERSKKKRRFRSLSPLGRDTPDISLPGNGGYGGGVALTDEERKSWRCHHCGVWGTAVWAVRDGPRGPKTLCHNCGYLYERDKKLPPWTHGLFTSEMMRRSG